MILIADSGSTKTDWAILDASGVVAEFRTRGINPVFRTKEDIEQELRPFLQDYKGRIGELHFFGAGIINASKGQVVADAICSIIGRAICEVDSDMLGAAKALCGNESGVVCILGTGSNACLYDGERLRDNVPPMGFILGDEASGAVMGKQLIGDYFKKVMPEEVCNAFASMFQLTKDEVIEQVYRKANPNKYLAQFTPFLSRFEHDYCLQLVQAQFSSFIERNILQLPHAAEHKINFVGSVAIHFEDILTEQLAQRKLQKGELLQSPIEGLKSYYLSKVAS